MQHTPRTHRLALYLMLTALMLTGCDLGGGQSAGISFPTVPSVLVSSTMENPGGIAAEYGTLYLAALNPRDGSVRWRYKTDWLPLQLVEAPVEVDGIVYTVSDPIPQGNGCSNILGNLVALRESDGRQLWSVTVGSLPTPPVVANGVVYTSALKIDRCGTPGPHQLMKSYYALRAGDGHQLWRTDLTENSSDANPDQSIGLDTSLQLVNGTLIATAQANQSESGDRTGHLFAFDPASGKLRWKNTFFANQNIYSITANGLLYVRTHLESEPTFEWTAYRASDGQQVVKISGGYDGQFLVVGGVIYADAMREAATNTPEQRIYDSQVVALDAETGKQMWQVAPDTSDVNGINRLVAVRDNTVYMQSGPSTFTETRTGHWQLEAVDRQTGHVRWSVPLQWLLGRVVSTDSALYAYSDDLLPGHVEALDPRDGHRIWSTPIGSQNVGTPDYPRSLMLGNGTLYAANYTSTITALQPQDGAVLWKAKMDGLRVEVTVVG